MGTRIPSKEASHSSTLVVLIDDGGEGSDGNESYHDVDDAIDSLRMPYTLSCVGIHPNVKCAQMTPSAVDIPSSILVSNLSRPYLS